MNRKILFVFIAFASIALITNAQVAAAADAYEPNGDIQHARALTPGTFTLTISDNLDQDFFNISLSIGDKINATVANYGGDEVYLQLWNGTDIVQEITVLGTTNSGSIIYTLPFTGNVTLYLRDADTHDTGEYTLTISVVYASTDGQPNGNEIAGYDIFIIIMSLGISSAVILAMHWRKIRHVTLMK